MVLGKSLKGFVEESRYAKFFNIASKTAQGFTLVLSVAATAVLGWKLYTDFADDAPMYEKVLDSLQVIESILSLKSDRYQNQKVGS